MQRFSIFSLVRNSLSYPRNWQEHWRSPEPKPEYDVIVIGAGGHGLATAYYLAKEHGVNNVCVLDKGWLGGGNTGRNTTIIRSNYLQDESAAIYELARSLYEGLSQELNYNIMFSPRGLLNVCVTEHEMRAFQRIGFANKLAGIESRMISAAEVQKLVPIMEWGPGRPLPAARGSVPATWRDRSARRDCLGVCARSRQSGCRYCSELRGHRDPAEPWSRDRRANPEGRDQGQESGDRGGGQYFGPDRHGRVPGTA